ncbi:ribonuclease H-like domain-containing protein [Tanacetum coccineum]
MWLFRHKFLADGTLSHYKAHLVVNGSTQLSSVDVDETFRPVVKPSTIRTILSLAISRHWHVHQLDVKNAFLHGDFSETVYMHQLPGFWDFAYPDYVCLLHRSLYGLKQVPRAWFQRFAAHITRRKYAIEILERAHMVGCNSSRTPVDTKSKLGDDDDPVSDPTLYRSLAGSLQYLTFTRPDISYAVQILRYVRGTLDHELQLFSSSTASLVAYSDVDWAGCLVTRRLASGYYVFLGNNLLSWSSKRQLTLSRSSVEEEYRGVANVHQRTKHIEIDIHFVRDLVVASQVRVLHVPSRYQYADIFTKGLPSTLFEDFRTSLSVRCPLTLTAGEC